MRAKDLCLKETSIDSVRKMSLREKSVFVGNITYETTEDQLTLSWRRLALSSPSNSCETAKLENTRATVSASTQMLTAQSAYATEREKCNGRELRVNDASSDGTERSNNNKNQSNAGSSSGASARQRPNEMGPSLAAVKAALDQLSIHEIYEVVKSMKMLVDQRRTMRRCCWRRPWLSRSCKRNQVGDDPRRPHWRRAYAQGANSSTTPIARKWGGAAAARTTPSSRSTSKYAATNDAHKPDDERSAPSRVSV